MDPPSDAPSPLPESPDALSRTPREQTFCPVTSGDRVGGRYRVESLVGVGSHAWVLAARDLGQPGEPRVALKLLRSGDGAMSSLALRLRRRELGILQRVAELGPSPHVVRPYQPEVEMYRGHPYLVLELIEGPSLAAHLGEGALERLDEVRRIGAGIARGLAALHRAGGVHRDLKPGNVRLRPTGEPVIVDLGVVRALWQTVRLTGEGVVLLTPSYAAPEQFTHMEVEPAADIYALGLILHQLLSGEVPLCGQTREETFALRLRCEAPDVRLRRPDTPPELALLVRRCLARDPAARPTAAEVVEALDPTRSRRGRRRLGARSWRGLALGPFTLAAAALMLDGATPSPPLGPCLAPPPGLAAWYPLDEEGVMAEEATGGPAGRRERGARTALGRVGRALALDGEGYVEVPHAAQLDVGRGDFTLALWLRADPTPGVKVLLDHRVERRTEPYVLGYVLSLMDGHPLFQLATGPGDNRCGPSPTSACTNYRSSRLVADGAWHLLVVAVERLDPRGGRIYVDGHLATIFDPTLRQGSLDNPAPLRLGSRSSSPSGLFRGRIDEVLLFRRALLPAEVEALHLAGSAGLCRPPASGAQDVSKNRREQPRARGSASTGAERTRGT